MSTQSKFSELANYSKEKKIFFPVYQTLSVLFFWEFHFFSQSVLRVPQILDCSSWCPDREWEKALTEKNSKVVNIGINFLHFFVSRFFPPQILYPLDVVQCCKLLNFYVFSVGGLIWYQQLCHFRIGKSSFFFCLFFVYYWINV